jgi:hypothetical protein
MRKSNEKRRESGEKEWRERVVRKSGDKEWRERVARKSGEKERREREIRKNKEKKSEEGTMCDIYPILFAISRQKVSFSYSVIAPFSSSSTTLKINVRGEGK